MLADTSTPQYPTKAICPILLEDYRKITIKEMEIWVRTVWTGQAETMLVSVTNDVDIIQLKILSSMISKWVINSLTPMGWRKLLF